MKKRGGVERISMGPGEHPGDPLPRGLLSHLQGSLRYHGPHQGRVTYRRAFSTFGTWRALQRAEVRMSVNRGAHRPVPNPELACPLCTCLAGGQEESWWWLPLTPQKAEGVC